MPPPASSALRRRLPDPRPDEPLLLEAFERRVDRADRDFASGVLLDFPPHGGAVGVGPQPHQRQQNQLFELAERDRRLRHMVHNVDVMSIDGRPAISVGKRLLIYSDLSAVSGSTRVARHAGIWHAATAVNASTPATIA